MNAQACNKPGMGNRTGKILRKSLETIQFPPVSLPFNDFHGGSAFKYSHPWMTTEVDEYSLELRTLLEPHNDLGLEQVDHPDVELLGSGLDNPAR